MDDQEIINEFLIESNENLARLDQEMVELEQRPKDTHLLASVFRTIHTIKGTCGFLGFGKLEAIAHSGENLLSRLRDGELDLTPELVTLILQVVDATKRILLCIEANGAEGDENHDALIQRLKGACGLKVPAPVAASAVAPPAVAPAAAAPPAEAPSAAPLPAAAIPAAALSAAPPPEAGSPAPKPAAAPVASDPETGPPPRETESASAQAEPENPASQKASAVSDSTIRVDVGLLDKLMNLVGELVLTRNQILQFNARQEDTTLNTTSQRLNLITTELQAGVMKTRMQPIGVVWNKLPRLVRDLATSSGKQIQLEMDGADTELDKTIIEAIKDPLTHIVRNCCDHGIEKPEVRLKKGKPAGGTLSLRAFHEGGQVNIEISDDGSGVDLLRVKEKALEKGLVRSDQLERMTEREVLGLIFLPGFSTAPKVTSVSGRGVGMDVVKTNIEKIGGAADIASRPGEGTTVKLKIPLTLAIIPGLVVKNGGERFVIPQVSLLELIRLEQDSGKSPIEWIHGTPVYRHRDRLLPITYLSQVLGQAATQNSDAVNIVVLQAEDRQFGLVVDDIQDTQEIVVKPLGKQLKGLSCYAGATIMGDGRVALILDVLGIGQLSGVVQESREQTKADAKHKDRSDRDRQTFLLFRAGVFERLSVPLALVARLEEFPKSKIEHAGGRRVVQYRGKILSLVSLTSILQGGEAGEIPDPVQVVVFGNGERSIGILVDQILDIVQETVEVRQPSRCKGMLGSAVIGGKVTDILDLQAIIEAADNRWFGKPELQASEKATVMLAEASSFTRGIVRSSLEMAGYNVIEAADARQALLELERRDVDVVAASLDLPAEGGFDFLEKMRRVPTLTGIPALALATCEEEKLLRGKHPVQFEDVQMKFDRDAMLRSLARLSAETGEHKMEPALAGDKE
jgi:two-component system chemotaxis sensor kinase CheA